MHLKIIDFFFFFERRKRKKKIKLKNNNIGVTTCILRDFFKRFFYFLVPMSGKKKYCFCSNFRNSVFTFFHVLRLSKSNILVVGVCVGYQYNSKLNYRKIKFSILNSHHMEMLRKYFHKGRT